MATSYPHIVMTVTPGRSGTRLLCQLLKPCPDSFVGHEPSPGFHAVLKNLRDRPALAKTFCEETKLPFIARQKTSHYIETGHIFCKGFLEAFVELGVPFDLIVLRRSFRDVAKSLERLGCIPGKTSSGLHYLLHPDQPDVLKIPSWQSLTNYQLAYWYTLEIARRQLLYAKLIREKGNRCAEITLDQLSDYEAFSSMCDAVSLPMMDQHRSHHARIYPSKVNKKRRFLNLRQLLGLSDYESMEREVFDRIAHPELVQELLASSP